MRRLFILVLLTTIVAACTKTDIDAEKPVAVEEEMIYATIEDGEQTRVELNSNKQTVWTEGDQIVRYGTNIYDVWTFNGKTGDRSGSFRYYGEWSQKPSYNFNGKYYAFYPYSNYVGWSTFSNDGSVAAFFNVPVTQSYHYMSYNPNSNAMLGVGDSATEFRFKNLMGYLRLSLTGDKCVKSITLEGNNNETLSGIRYFGVENTELAAWYSDTLPTKIIECGDGVQLTDEPTQFYFSLIPTTFEKGFNITVTFTDGTTYIKNTTKSVEIARNTIQPMANIDTNAEAAWQTVVLQHSGERIYAPSFYDATSSPIKVGYVYWGDDVISMLKDVVEYYTYGDNKDSHEVTLKTQDATILQLKSCAGISEIDLTNF